MSAWDFDVIVLGAGAAGLMCAIEAGKRGRRVLVVDHAKKAAEKIRISGGGRCNFTNLHTSPANFLSRNPHFAISALSRYTPQDFIALVERHGIVYHEKARGQLFCNGSSQQIIHMLIDECRQASVTIKTATTLRRLSRYGELFSVDADGLSYLAKSFVVASGGLSIPKIGASAIGYQIAKQFNVSVVPTRPALVPLTFSHDDQRRWPELAGVAFPAAVRCEKQSFHDASLFTHHGLSGPAILQISSYWQEAETPSAIRIDMAPQTDASAALLEAKRQRPQQELVNAMSEMIPRRLAQAVAHQTLNGRSSSRLGSLSDKLLQQIGKEINGWAWMPDGTEGYRIAEVTLGGLDTNELSSQTMECKKMPGLFFIGEVVDVTGHLGGFNFQWAWASGFAAGQTV